MMAAAGVRAVGLEEVALHNKEGDCWLVIDGKVYDVSQFLAEHPGGKKVILRVGGKDATIEFHKFHKVEEVLQKYGPKLLLGKLTTAEEVNSKETKEEEHLGNDFGDLIPHGDPSWYQGHNSPYFKDTHRKYRAAVREIIDRECMPHVMDWDEAKQPPADIWKKLAQWGLLAGLLGSYPWPVQYAGTNIAGGIPPEEYDVQLDILADELARTASFGFCALFAGVALALPPVHMFGSDLLKDKVLTPCLHGDKVPCLAITEPTAGSDVAAIKTEAKLSPCGKFYIVNGEKKFITAGFYADFFITAVRTGGEGMGGLSLLVIERGPGVNARRMDCQGMWCSGTAYVTFEDVKVPVENLIGEENGGFIEDIMYNFNKERLGMIIQAVRFARVCYEESFKYAHKRKTFGKRLIDHPVIRNKLAHMVRQIEATQTWVDHIMYQSQTMPFEVSQSKLAGSVALLKVQTSVTFEFCAREASQIFGGLAYTRVGQGEKVERLYRDVRGIAIPGGSEEILLDLGIRQAMRLAQQAKAKL